MYSNQYGYMPNYQQQYQQQQYQSPYPYMNRQQEMIQNNQSMMLQGKVVDSIDVVKATDIPMDGNNYYFPKADGSEIFVKKWLPNGTTQISKFVQFEEQNEMQENKPDRMSEIFEMLGSMNEKIDKLEKAFS